MGFLKRFGFERSANIPEEPRSIEDVNELLRLAEQNHDVQAVLEAYEDNMKEISQNVMLGGGTTTAQDRDLMVRYAAVAATSLQELGYDVSPEIVDQSL